ncbi:SCO0607 family lipoprotein [Streptomyces sp. NPDC093094]|uniref:SCO0607 family lipoprotein n=1 Tax=Streptomyces sp. NPDC093094 TaxID=3366026 RepID=UPI0037F11FC3
MSASAGTRRTSTALPTRLRVAGAALAGTAALLALTGCSGLEYREAVCSDGHYPVLAVNNSGSDCVQDGKEPAPGWTRYPEGKVPQDVDDKWYVYWQDHTLDEDGNIVDSPAR